VDEALQYFRAKVEPTSERADRLIADLVAIHTLGALVETVNRSPMIPALLERLQAMGGGDPRLTSKGSRSKERDAMFELLCWHVCTHFASDVAFGEPDIQCTHDRHRFGIACKAIYGRPATAVQAIRKGWHQVRSSPVDHGLVMIHLTNLLPRRRYARGQLVASDEGTLNALFREDLTGASAVIEEEFLRYQERNPRSRDGFHGVLYAAHAIAQLQNASVVVGGTVYQRVRRDPPAEVWSFVSEVNDFWQNLYGVKTTSQ
jgi:hypothetical protein